MEPDESYNLHHRAKEFKEEVERKGFNFDGIYNNAGNYNITKRVTSTSMYPHNIIRIGEIVNNRFLIIWTSQCGKGDKKRDEAVSKLQKLAREFEIK